MGQVSMLRNAKAESVLGKRIQGRPRKRWSDNLSWDYRHNRERTGYMLRWKMKNEEKEDEEGILHHKSFYVRNAVIVLLMICFPRQVAVKYLKFKE